MKYKIDILSKDACTFFSSCELKQNCVIISINDTGGSTLIYENEKIQDVYKVEFDDIEIPIDGYILFNSKIGYGIKNFVDSFKDKVSHFVIHCTAGISRSGAVGCVIARYLNGDDTYLLKTGRYIPNKLVYEKMCNSFGISYSQEYLEEKLNLKYSKTSSRDDNYTFDDIFFDIQL